MHNNNHNIKHPHNNQRHIYTNIHVNIMYMLLNYICHKKWKCTKIAPIVQIKKTWSKNILLGMIKVIAVDTNLPTNPTPPIRKSTIFSQINPSIFHKRIHSSFTKQNPSNFPQKNTHIAHSIHTSFNASSKRKSKT